MKLVTLSTAHLPKLLWLAKAMHGESRYAAHALDEGHVQQVLTHCIMSPQFYAKGAKDGDRLVGAMLGSLTPELWTGVLMGRDLALYVAPEARGGRAGVALLRDFEGWCKERGALYVMPAVTVGIDDERVGQLYQRLGYEPAGNAYLKEVA